MGTRAGLDVLESLAPAGIETQVAVPTVNVSETVRNVSLQQWRLAYQTEPQVQGGSNMTGADLYVNKPHCAAAVRP